MKKFAKLRIGDVLLKSGLITEDQIKEALHIQEKTGIKLGEVLIQKGYISKKSMMEVLEYQLGIPYVNLSTQNVEPNTARLIPENMARRYEIVPIKFENNTLTVACNDPLNTISFDDVRIYTGFEVQPVLADVEQINILINRHFSSKKAIDAIQEFSKANNQSLRDQIAAASEADLVQDINKSPAVKLINILIEQAIQSGASDIHIEPQSRYVRIRFRIDGQLRDIMKPDIEILPSIVSRIKVMAELNIAEKRLPQDGRIAYKMNQDEIDLRISVLPTIFGEKVVIRVISKATFDIPKEQLGFTPENLSTFNAILKNPHGIVLVTGPTGSGKTTTLYTAIKELNKPEVNIVTVEDPIESAIEGITQVASNSKIGLDFGNSLRSILRQDPDIIMIGEIRDNETAEIAVRAAITGHLVLSTMHTNDAGSSIARLIDMGVQPFLVSTSVVGIIAQRLVRRICNNCKSTYIPSKEELDQFGSEKAIGLAFYKGRGCTACNGTGYKGRIAIHEVMKIGAENRQAIYNCESADKLNEIAVKNGMTTLWENCRSLVLAGITTFEEMIKVAYVQE